MTCVATVVVSVRTGTDQYALVIGGGTGHLCGDCGRFSLTGVTDQYALVAGYVAKNAD